MSCHDREQGGGRERIQGLDSLRAISLAFVLVQHSFLFTDEFFPKFRVFWIFSHSALDIFFVLSGFLIGKILFETYRIKKSFSLQDLMLFTKRRWYKILPMYYLTILISLLLVQINVYDAPDFSLKFILFAQNFFVSDFIFLPQTYSLTIEEWFYILLPITLLIISKIKTAIKISNQFYVIGAVWILIVLILRINFHINGVENWDAEIRKTIFSRIDAPIYGVLFFVFFNSNRIWLYENKNKLIVIGAFCYLGLTYLLSTRASLFFNNVIFYTLIPLVLTFLIPFFYYLKLPKGIQRILSYQSLSSYSIYLIHLPLLSISFKFFKPETGMGSLVCALTYIAASYLLGMFFYSQIELRILKFRDRQKEL